MPTRKRYVLVSLVYVLAAYAVLLLGPDVAAQLGREDGFFEMLGAAAFLVASLLFAASFVRVWKDRGSSAIPVLKRLSYAAMALLLFLAAGEEISWGQRILGLETPESVQAINIQDELNIHNLEFFQVTPETNLLRWFWIVFWFTFTLGVPVLTALSGSARWFFDRLIPIVPWALGGVFLVNYVVWRVIYTQTSVEEFFHHPEEIMESNLAVLFVVVALWVFRESDIRPAEAPPHLA